MSGDDLPHALVRVLGEGGEQVRRAVPVRNHRLPHPRIGVGRETVHDRARKAAAPGDQRPHLGLAVRGENVEHGRGGPRARRDFFALANAAIAADCQERGLCQARVEQDGVTHLRIA